MNDQDYILKNAIQNQIGAANCAIPSFGYYPQAELYSKKKLVIEAVEGGYIISGSFHGKGDLRTVAVSADGLAEILKGWCAQFQADA